MAKDSNGRTKWIGTLIILVVLVAGIGGTWALNGENIEDNTIAIIKLDKDGCKPTITLNLDVALMKKDIGTIQTSQDEMKFEQREMRTEQQKAFHEILKRLPQ